MLQQNQITTGYLIPYNSSEQLYQVRRTKVLARTQIPKNQSCKTVTLTLSTESLDI